MMSRGGDDLAEALLDEPIGFCSRAVRSSTRQPRPQVKGLMLAFAALHGADDIGEAEGLAASVLMLMS